MGNPAPTVGDTQNPIVHWAGERIPGFYNRFLYRVSDSIFDVHQSRIPKPSRIRNEQFLEIAAYIVLVGGSTVFSSPTIWDGWFIHVYSRDGLSPATRYTVSMDPESKCLRPRAFTRALVLDLWMIIFIHRKPKATSNWTVGNIATEKRQSQFIV